MFQIHTSTLRTLFQKYTLNNGQENVSSPIHLFKKILVIPYVPDTMLGARDTAISKKNKVSVLKEIPG